MKFRLVMSLVLMAVLVALYLWFVRPADEPNLSTDTSVSAPVHEDNPTPGLGRLRIF